MAAPTNRAKLGLFVLLGIGVAIATALTFGALAFRKETIGYHTYFNESVQGLELGSPVKFRGVTIGHVDTIEIAPDHRHVDVFFKLDVRDIKRLGLSEMQDGRRSSFRVPPDLRAQLGSQGITGVKFVAIDFFSLKAHPPPDLPFEVPEHYIPAAQSMMKGLEDTVVKAMDKLPELVDAVVAIALRVDRMVATLESEEVVQKASQTLQHADQVLVTVNRTVSGFERSHLPEKASKTIDDLQVAVGKMNKVLDRLDGDTGLLAAATSTAQSFSEVGRDARGTARELDATLREVREAAEAIRLLADTLESDPDMLLKGRAVKGTAR
jgi:phospholipid/cholesterol/gamma-HCH transport system substrate-binding protein